MLAYLNGQYVARSAAMIPVDDRGFVFGDGVYEVWRVIDGGLFEEDRHLSRLALGLREISISAVYVTQPGFLRGVADRLLAESGLTTGEATFYVQVTRGAAPRSHSFPPPGTSPTVYATVNPFMPADDLRTRGARAVTIPDTRWLRCDLKTLQLLPNVLAKQAALEAGALDALMIRDGVVTEGSHTNVFGVVKGVLQTHPANNLILPGVTRRLVLEIARDIGIATREHPIGAAEIGGLDELFLAGTTTDIMPIVAVNGARIGSGTPGALTKQLAAHLRTRLDDFAATRSGAPLTASPA